MMWRMAKEPHKKNKKQLREQIRSELEQKYQNKQNEKSDNSQLPTSDEKSYSHFYRRYMEQLVYNQTADDVYGRHVEFIRCENHLGEIKWLTPIEEENDQEFTRQEKTWWKALLSIFRKSSKIEIPQDSEIDSLKEKWKEEFEADALQRIENYHHQIEKDRKQYEEEKNLQKIYQQEEDRFFKNKPGYKKYRNQKGEIRWMTEDEFEEQEEYYEEASARYRRWLYIAASLIFVITAILAWLKLPGNGQINRGYLVVESNRQAGTLYLNKSQVVGFALNEPFPLEAGDYEVALIDRHYRTIPAKHSVSITKNDTITVSFEQIERALQNAGYIEIDSPYNDAAIYLDFDFVGRTGDYNLIAVEAGQHDLALQKEGMETRPEKVSFDVTAGDTHRVAFQFINKQNVQPAEQTLTKQALGMLEVTSNVKEADIYLNGRKTGHKTDYIFQQLEPGKHVVRLQKPGYKIYPNEKVITISENQRNVKATFTLSSTFRNVRLVTRPVKGDIYVDGEKVGAGTARISLQLGKHAVQFGKIQNYREPDVDSITVTQNGNEDFIFRYNRKFFVEFKPEGVEPSPEMASIDEGYVRGSYEFKYRRNAKIERRTLDKLNDEMWFLGFPFQYRNPPGREALKFNFFIPDNVLLDDNIRLKVWGYQTKDNFPLALSGSTMYTIITNSVIVKENIAPKFVIDDAGEEQYSDFSINDFLRHGNNQILIFPSPQASAYFALWKVVIQ
ncbi:MAG: PEGA domain-containing protein [Caldithrix sp.]|nr:PEGA domain-containing protein [Caldithrix sp.]